MLEDRSCILRNQSINHFAWTIQTFPRSPNFPIPQWIPRVNFISPLPLLSIVSELFCSFVLCHPFFSSSFSKQLYTILMLMRCQIAMPKQRNCSKGFYSLSFESKISHIFITSLYHSSKAIKFVFSIVYIVVYFGKKRFSKNYRNYQLSFQSSKPQSAPSDGPNTHEFSLEAASGASLSLWPTQSWKR